MAMQKQNKTKIQKAKTLQDLLYSASFTSGQESLSETLLVNSSGYGTLPWAPTLQIQAAVRPTGQYQPILPSPSHHLWTQGNPDHEATQLTKNKTERVCVPMHVCTPSSKLHRLSQSAIRSYKCLGLGWGRKGKSSTKSQSLCRCWCRKGRAFGSGRMLSVSVLYSLIKQIFTYILYQEPNNVSLHLHL